MLATSDSSLLGVGDPGGERRLPLRVLEALSGRRILVTGATGFVGKVAVALLLDRQPEVGRVYAVVRPKPGRKPQERLLQTLEESPAFSPLRRAHGKGFADFIAGRVEALEGDVTRADFGLEGARVEALRGGVDVLIHIAGLVDFNPPLDRSWSINVDGARNAARLAVKLGARLVHVSTCFVAGARGGSVREDEPPAGCFDAEEEEARSRELIARTRDFASTQASGRFLEEARRRLRSKGRDAAEGRPLRLAAERLAERWVLERLVEEGLARARDLGRSNIYCYTKAVGEQVIARTEGLDYCIVRPSIVESSLAFPFPGWNEGLNTSAPVILAMCKGYTPWPAHPSASIDFIPVDMVASGIVAVAGAAVLGVHERVYHLGSSDTNPLAVRRCMRYVGRYSRERFRDHATGPLWLHWLKTRPGVVTISRANYLRFGAPALRRAAGALSRGLGRARATRALSEGLSRLERELAQIERVVETFLPFIHGPERVFRTDNIRALFARLAPEERRLLSWAPEKIDWPAYWLDVHIAGLRRWVFPRPGEAAPRRGIGYGLVRKALAAIQRLAYGALFKTEVRGARNIPARGGYLVASNHASHLDMGLIKHALGPAGEGLVPLAARDYFFRPSPVGYFFRNYTDALPIGRGNAVKDALERASRALKSGRNLLIFPEATRSVTGEMAPFKPTLGFLALRNGADVLPVLVDGTFQALPKGRVIPRGRRLRASIGPVLRCEDLRRATAHLPPKEAYRAATVLVEEAVRRLRSP